MFKLPEDLGQLSADDLRALASKIRSEAAEKIKAGEDLNAVLTAKAEAIKAIDAEKALRVLAAEEEADVDQTPDEADAPEEEEVEEEPAEVEEEPEAPTEAAAEPARPRRVPAARGATGTTPVPAKQSDKRVGISIFEATDRAPQKRVGESFESWTELAENLLQFSGSVSGTSDQRFPIATARANFQPEMVLSDKPVDNLKLFDEPWKASQELTAALCAPLPPVYDLACMNSTARPVRASLPNYAAPRGGVTVMVSPSLEDITTGYDVWDRFDDANAGATKVPCATVKCMGTNSYYIYAVYRCMTVKNLLAMTYPELVEAFLNRLAALQARLAETTILEAMAADTTTITAHQLGYNATTSITSNLLNYFALYREQQRWDDQEFDAWLPRWVLPALQADQLRRKRFDGGVNTVPSEAEVTRVFTSAGVTPHFFRDTPSWATPIPKLQTSGTLGWFPRNLEVLVAPRGKFALMDRGELNIGVTGNIMRDNTSLSKNEFTFFFENFEGVVNTTSCPAHILHFDNLCYNGVQIQDVVINCEGGDQVGAAS
jgi:hypothetical protein